MTKQPELIPEEGPDDETSYVSPVQQIADAINRLAAAIERIADAQQGTGTESVDLTYPAFPCKDGKTWQPTKKTLERWEEEFRDAGFGFVDQVLREYHEWVIENPNAWSTPGGMAQRARNQLNQSYVRIIKGRQGSRWQEENKAITKDVAAKVRERMRERSKELGLGDA